MGSNEEALSFVLREDVTKAKLLRSTDEFKYRQFIKEMALNIQNYKENTNLYDTQSYIKSAYLAIQEIRKLRSGANS